MSVKNYSLLILATLFLWTGCYSFKGISIAPEVKTFNVPRFRDNAEAAAPTLSQTMTEALREKIRSESRLIFEERDADVEFVGVITSYKVTSEAPQAGSTTAFDRLTISVSVEYTNNQDESQNFKKTYREFADFASNQNLLSVQDDLIDEITPLIVEKVFNDAFTNW